MFIPSAVDAINPFVGGNIGHDLVDGEYCWTHTHTNTHTHEQDSHTFLPGIQHQLLCHMIHKALTWVFKVT